MTEMPVRFQFHWRWPTLTVYRATNPRPLQIVLNRYPGAVIGCAIQMSSRVFSLVWGRPGETVRDAAARD
jgi:hypothetical protein